MQNRTLLNVWVHGGGNKSRYQGFGDALNFLNNELFSGDDANLDTMIRMYEDGNSPTDLWAVRSLGIDPATGREMFLTRDGETTYTWRQGDRVKIANSNPVINGVIGTSFAWRGKLTAAFNLRYQLGGYQLNRALFNKVENITQGQVLYNQDKRALYDRWQTPGDVSSFRGISLTNATQMSSRFIQKNNQLRGESIRISWNFSRDEWIRNFGLKDLQTSISMQDIFYLSTIKAERGIDYPFERGVTFNVSARF
jgi:hypothetical protein